MEADDFWALSLGFLVLVAPAYRLFMRREDGSGQRGRRVCDANDLQWRVWGYALVCIVAAADHR